MGIFFDKGGGEFVPVVYEEFLRKFEAQPEVQIFLHLRALTIPNVALDEKFDITKTGLPNCYRMVIRYGYDDSPVIPQLGRVVYDEVRNYLTHYVARKSSTVLAMRQESNAPETTTDATEPSYENEKDVSEEGESSSLPSSLASEETARRLATLDQAYRTQVLFIVGKLQLRMPDHTYNIFKRVLLRAFMWMRESTMERVTSMKISMDKLVECGFIREI